jgi:hypothetical protein
MKQKNKELILQDLQAAQPVNECPVISLGVSGSTYYFLKPTGEQLALSCHQMNPNGLVSLFSGDVEWLVENYPTGGKAKKESDFDAPEVAKYLIKVCEDKGIHDVNKQIRTTGAWKDSELGGLVIHCGDHILRDGGTIKTKPGAVTHKAIYAASPPIEPPADKPATADDVKLVLDTLALWNFEKDIAPRLILGFLVQGYIGGSLSWRAHIMANGEAGTGKSELIRLVAAALGGAANAGLNDGTEAGIRQSMSGTSRALILDEAEHEEGSNTAARIITLLRRMSSGQGSRSVRGSSGGKSQGYNLTCAVFLACILHTPLKPQDRSRITILNMRPLRSGSEQSELVRTNIEAIEEIAPALWRRAINNAHLLDGYLKSYHAGFVSLGLNNRAADQAATLLAGADILLHDLPPDSDYIQEQIEAAASLVEEAQAQSDDGEGQQCLNYLLTSPIDVHRNGARQTVSQTIIDAMGDNGQQERKALANLGMRLEGLKFDEQPYLLIANRHSNLCRIFKETRWANGGHAGILKHLKGVQSVDPTNFAGAKSRATLIPAIYLPAKGDDA